MTDRFFTTMACDRCGSSLEDKPRKMSWFTEDCLCPDCVLQEEDIKERALKRGIDTADLEGIGYIPQF